MLTYLFKGVLIGLLFGLPVGVVGTMTVQRTWSFGFKAGLLTGLGSSFADCLYAIVGAFSITLISEFLLRHQAVIHFLGGGLVFFMGIRLLLKNEKTRTGGVKAISGITMFLSSFVIGITNPAAILTFLFAFSYFEISDVNNLPSGSLLVCGVFIGTYIWWTILSGATYFIKNKTKNKSFLNMNKVFGGILTLFGVIIFVQSFIN